MSFWKREKICCGTIFRAPNGEVAVDVRYINPCESCNNPLFKFAAAVKESPVDHLKIVANTSDFKTEVIPKVSIPKSGSGQSSSVFS